VTTTYDGRQFHHHSFWDYTLTADLLDKYLGFTALAVGYRGITFIQFIGILSLLSVLAYYLYRLHHQRVILALLVTTWVSILCPLAWIVLAQGHSGSETGTDRYVWNLPFTFLALALIGVVLEQGSQEVRRIINRLHTG